MSGDAAWAPLLRAFRGEAGLTQAELALRAGISLDSLRSYEGGRRRPARAVIDAISATLELSRPQQMQLLIACGEETAASPLLQAIGSFRAEPAAMAAEVASYDWVTIIMNERHEILAWNALANAVAEMDLGVDLPTQFERNLLWMASMPHFEKRLTNWDELIGRLIGILKVEGVAVEKPGGIPPYLQALIAALAKERPEMLERFYRLWLSAPIFREGTRNHHPVKWRLGDGTELAFVGPFREWSVFDGTFAFDWNAADRATTAWVEKTFASAGARGWAPEVRELEAASLPELLEESRKSVAMSRRDLAERTGLSEDAIYKFETGQRRPKRETLMTIARALSVDGLRTNALCRAAGYDEEPSDFARVIAGYEGAGIFNGRPAFVGRTREEIHGELADLQWAAFLVNARCEVEGANHLGNAITHYSSMPRPAGRDGPHLLQFMMGPLFRERLQNWAEVARAIVPRSLRPIVQGYRNEKRPGHLAEVIGMLRREDPQALHDLDAAWSAQPERTTTPRRIHAPIAWRDDDGRLLRFHCFIAGWNAYDPYWAVDWHPANDAAWDAVERAR